MSDDRARLNYRRLTVAREDIWMIGYCAQMIRKKRWFHPPYDRKRAQVAQQAVHVTALIVAYGRLFTDTKVRSGNNVIFKGPLLEARFGNKLFANDERKLHSKLLNMRHQIYAHSELNEDRVQNPKYFGSGLVSAVERMPSHQLDPEEIEMLLAMLSKMGRAMNEFFEKYRLAEFIANGRR